MGIVPVNKNKFLTFLGTRLVQGDTFTGTLPMALQKGGDFSQTYNSSGALITIYNPFSTTQNSSGQYVRTPFQGNIIPSGAGGLTNPTAQAYLNLFPAPNTPTTSPTELITSLRLILAGFERMTFPRVLTMR